MRKVRASTTDIKRPRRKFRQARGDARRKLLLETALILVRQRYIDDITYQDIAREADMPLASCYHFFPGKMELFAELIDYAGPWHKFVTVTALTKPAETWPEVYEHLSEALISAYEADLAFLQLFSTWKIPGNVYAGREPGILEAAERIRQAVDRQFIRPRFKDEVGVFAYATRISDAIWRSSLSETGHVSDFARREAQRAATSYLFNYVPPILERRENPIEMPALALPTAMPEIVAGLIADPQGASRRKTRLRVE
ncbi:MAG: TetR/AcrR family transcriptional regulator [Rhizomicrobium sp.]